MKISEKVIYKGSEFKIVRKTSIEGQESYFDIQNNDVIIQKVFENRLKPVKN